MGAHKHFGQIPQTDVDGLTTALDGKAGTGHNHDASYSATGHTHSYIASSEKGAASGVGTLTSSTRQTAAEIPIVRHQIRTGNVTTSVTSDAGSGAGNLVNINTNGGITVNPPTNPVDWQAFDHHFVAVGADRTVTFAGGYVSAGPSLGPYTVPRGKVLVTRSEYIGNRANSSDVAAPAWALLSAGITDALSLPNPHASTHATAGADPIAPGDIGAATSGHNHDASYATTGHNHTGTYQPLDSDLTTIAGLTPTTDNFMVAASSAWASRTPAQAKTALGLVKADVGLGNVDNTADTAKPVSTATQTALDGKASTTHAAAHKASGSDPLVPDIEALSNVSNGNNISCDCSTGDLFRVTTTGATATLAVPTNAVDGKPINVEVTANTGLTLSLHASIVNCSGATFPAAVASSKKAFLGLRPISTTWYLLAYSVEP